RFLERSERCGLQVRPRRNPDPACRQCAARLPLARETATRSLARALRPAAERLERTRAGPSTGEPGPPIVAQSSETEENQHSHNESPARTVPRKVACQTFGKARPSLPPDRERSPYPNRFPACCYGRQSIPPSRLVAPCPMHSNHVACLCPR